VFTTAFDTFALRAFRYHAADYLLKPVAPTELSNTVERLKNQIFSPREQLLESLKNSFKVQKVDRIAISTAEGITFLEVAHILRLESDGNYTTFFTEQGEVIIASRGISDFEDLLPNSDFCRVHQSHVVQLRHVRKFLKEDGGYALMSNGHKIPVSRRKKDVFLDLLMKGKG
jgi:two-component system LytT family response regulator